MNAHPVLFAIAYFGTVPAVLFILHYLLAPKVDRSE